MSVENKIRELMSGRLNEAGSYPGMGKSKEEASAMQGSSKKAEVQILNKGTGAGASVKGSNVLRAGAGAMEKSPARQGSSQDASISTRDTEATQGKTQSAKAKKQPVPVGRGAGAAPNFVTHVDPSSVINQSSSKGNVYHEEVEEYDEDDFITEEEYNALSDEERAEYDEVELVEEDEEYDEEYDEDDFITEDEYNELSDEEQAEYEYFELDEDTEEMEEGKSFFRPPEGFTKKGIKKVAKKYNKEQKPSTTASDMADKNAERRQIALHAKQGMKEELAMDVENLFSSEADLSEDFKAKVASLFEAAVTARVAHEMETIEDILAEAAVEEVANMYHEIVENVDAYLSYVSTQWLQENAIEVESGLRTEITEDFIAGLKVLFQENYIEIPEEKFDVIAAMQEEIAELTEKVNEAMSESIELNSHLEEAKKEIVFSRVTSDLAQTEAEKLFNLIEEVDFENEEIFEEKVTAIKNNFFSRSNSTTMHSLNEEAPETEEMTGSIAKYVEVLSRGK